MKKKLIILASAMILALGFSFTVCAQPETMPDGTVFDAEYYAQANPDVAAIYGMDANLLYQHYIQFGKAEGRLATAQGNNGSAEAFDAEYYAQANPDVAAIYGMDANLLYQHYIQFGRAEGRSASRAGANATTIPAATPQITPDAQTSSTLPVSGIVFAVNGRNGKIHIVGACPATGTSSSAMREPIYYNTYKEAEACSVRVAPALDNRQCGNCW